MRPPRLTARASARGSWRGSALAMGCTLQHGAVKGAGAIEQSLYGPQSHVSLASMNPLPHTAAWTSPQRALISDRSRGSELNVPR
jgi:hypothetical protein